MKVQLVGHDEKYVVEQTLLALFPGEKLSYGPADPAADRRWAVITMEDREGGGSRCCHVTTELGWDGNAAPYSFELPLSGTDYEQEGLRRHALGMCIFRAAQAVTGIAPPWGSLTGIRPGKIAARSLEGGASPRETQTLLEDYYRVTPPRARLALEAAQAGLRAGGELEGRDIAVYIGIPFCPTRCAYCSFVSASVEKSLSQVEPYLAALEEEVRAAGALVRRLGLRVRAFYMGGGTPTTLTAEQMDRLLGVLEDAFELDSCAERTVEAGRPDTVTAEKLRVMKRRGVTRVSVNPQSMDDNVLRAIGRRHTAEDIRRAMGEVAEAGFAHVNMDLIAGLPADTPEGFCASLQECMGFGADNLTVHTLSLKKGSAILTRNLPIPTAEAVGRMLDYADPALRAAGYEPYYLYRQKYMSGSFENVGWCMPGAENLYNIYIMEELCSILSMGAGGSTKMVAPGRISRAFNLKYPGEYTRRREKWQSNQAAFAAFYEAMKGAGC
ncbi:MAG: coproporphyrinogen dehydrogenase HemZ [Oscillibacter sp.]|jgi:oxygen-independent coproporphyrinogen-3 oxidase|nr:coproporphyrinogen dehydrogenase HemZ [Oscillibacter sp.]